MIYRPRNPWLVALTAAGFFFYQFMQLTMFNTLQPELLLRFNADATQLSLVSSAYFFGNIVMLLPAGLLLDIVSTRKILLWTMFVSLIGIYLFSTTTSPLVAGIGRLIIGSTAGCVSLTGGLRLSARWFPEDQFAFVSGTIISIGMFGAIVSQTGYTWLINTYDYATAMQINFLAGIICFLAMYLFIADCPPGAEQQLHKQMQLSKQQGFSSNFKQVISKAQNWYCGIFGSLLNLPIMIIGSLWGVMYLLQVFSLSNLQASIVCSAMFFGMLIGAPIVGYISDQRKVRKTSMYVGIFVCLISTCMLLLIPNLSYQSLICLFFVIGFSSSAQVLAYPAATESNPPAMTGSALGLTSLCIMSGGAIFQPFVGYLINSGWNGKFVENMPFYSARDYLVAFCIIPVAFFVAALMVQRMRETNCKFLS